MHILCTICSDLVNQAESLYVTKCGHIFHHQCLAQWIERSKSCPQCRNKVTERCMFRMYPTVSNESSAEDAATLQSRLDDAMLQLRTQRAAQAQLQERLAALTQDFNKKEELLRAAEKRLASRESAVAALREQLEYAKLQSNEAQRLRHENENLNKNLHTLNGLQKVLNATAAEVEDTLRGYSDLRTVATFAAALKHALCESEAKKRASREQLRSAEQRLAAQRQRQQDALAQLGQVQERLSMLQRKYSALLKRKASDEGAPRDAKQRRAEGDAPSPSPSHSPRPRPAPPAPNLNDAIVTERNATAAARAEAEAEAEAESPYLRLKQSGLALSALQRRRPQPTHLKPSEFALLSSSPSSIFHRAAPPPPRGGARSPPPPDGLGGRSRPDVFPSPRRPPPRSPPRPPRPLVPRLSAKHKLRRPDPAGSRDIKHMFARLNDKCLEAVFRNTNA